MKQAVDDGRGRARVTPPMKMWVVEALGHLWEVPGILRRCRRAVRARRGDGVTDAFLASGRWQLEVAGERCQARALLTPPYDPQSLRVRA